MSFSPDWAHNRESLISSDVLSWAVRYVKLINSTKVQFYKGKHSRPASEIYKWSFVLLLEVDYNLGIVFSVSALISATKMPLVLFLERVVPVRQLTVSWCVVSRLDVTLSGACYSFLICFVKVMLSLCFSSFPQSFLAASYCSPALLFSHFLPPFSFSRSTRVNVAVVSQRRWEDWVLMLAQQTLPYHGQKAFFHLWLV